MTQRRIPAVYMRGGSSKGVFFRQDDLPADRALWDRIFLSVIGGNDPYGRQLNGMGGGVSSVSKAVVVGPPTVDGADVDYFFGQVAIDRPLVDVSATCGNLSSAIAPFAVDQGLVAATGAETTVRVHIVNTGKLYHARIATEAGRFQEAGGFEIPGVAGSGSRIRLDYLDPGGATTGALLPTGNVLDVLDVPGVGRVEASLVDAATGMVFVAAERFGRTAAEPFQELEADGGLMAALDATRRAGAVAMGLAAAPDAAPLGNPRVALVGPAACFTTLAGTAVPEDAADVSARILSMGQVHRVLPLTSAMCLAVACRMEGSVPHRYCRQQAADLRLANPSGVLPVDARLSRRGDGWKADTVTTYRTARTLMEGVVMVPA